MSKCAAPSIGSGNAFDLEQFNAFASSRQVMATSSLENPIDTSLMILTIKNLASGIIAGSCEALAGYPLETVKARMQTQPRRANGLPYYSGMIDCVQQSVRDGGIASLYRGALPQIIRSAIRFVAVGHKWQITLWLFSKALPYSLDWWDNIAIISIHRHFFVNVRGFHWCLPQWAQD